MRKRYGRWMIIMLLAGAGQGVPGYAAEEGTVKATSAWQGQGRFFQVGKDQAFFVGGFEGIMYVETKTGALDAAKIICPGTVDLNLKTGDPERPGPLCHHRGQRRSGVCHLELHGNPYGRMRWYVHFDGRDRTL